MHSDWTDTSDSVGKSREKLTRNYGISSGTEVRCSHSRNCTLVTHCTANKESVRLEQGSSINIDHGPDRSLHGGGHADFMDAASRRVGRTGGRLQVNGTDVGNTSRGSSTTEDEESAVTNKRGCLNFASTCPKRKGCNLSRAPKRACFEEATVRAPCGVSGSGVGDSVHACTPCSGLLLKCCAYNEYVEAKYQIPSDDGGNRRGGRRPCLTGRDRSDNLLKHALLYRPTATGNSRVNIGSTDGLGVGTAKGRVRLYRVCSFISQTPGYNRLTEDVTEDADGTLNFAQDGVNPTLVRFCSSTGGVDISAKQETGVKGERFARGSGSGKLINGNTNKGIQARKNQTPATSEGGVIHNDSRDRAHEQYSECEKSAPGVETSEAAHCREIVEIGTDVAKRRQVRLQERTERLRRRLRVVQVKQVERHVAQQLQGLVVADSRRGDLNRTIMSPASSGELRRLARSCSEVLRTAEGGIDSDQTASSSGGESEVEERPMHCIRSSKRVQDSPEWQWAKERAWLGSRWVWLQAHVSELEYRIRGLSELYVGLRQAKGRGAHKTTGSLLPLQIPHREPPAFQPRKNNWHSVAAACPHLQTEEPPHTAAGSSAARVRALPSWNRPRLLCFGDSPDLVAKMDSELCRCLPLAFCVLCADSPPCSPFEMVAPPLVRSARLDLSLHPVLSSFSDVHLNLQCGALLRTIPISHNALHSVSRLPPKPWLAGRGQGSHRAGRPRRRVLCSQPRPLVSDTDWFRERQVRGPAWSSHQTLPTELYHTTPSAHDACMQPQRRRRDESSFDIDNLVMPLGLASLGGGARLQRPQYKEILTPSWRLMSWRSRPRSGDRSSEKPTEEDQQDEEVEDLSDAVILSRHAQSECKEKGRWSLCVRRPRGRAGCRGLGRRTRLKPRFSLTAECSSWTPSLQEAPGRVEKIFVPGIRQRAVSPWERRSFPLSESELQQMEDKDAEGPSLETHKDLCGPAARSQSTDSGISVGSLALSPVAPQPTKHVPLSLTSHPALTNNSGCPTLLFS